MTAGILRAPEAERTVTAAFVAKFWKEARTGSKAAFRLASEVKPEMLLHADLRTLYELLLMQHAQNLPVDEVSMGVVVHEAQLPRQLLREVNSAGQVQDTPTSTIIADVTRAWQRSESFGLAFRAATHLANAKVSDGGRRTADKLTLKLLGLFHSNDASGGYKSKDALIDELLEEHYSEKAHGVPYWLPKLDKAIGPCLPGEVVAWCGYTGTGKTVWSTNLFRELIIRGTPCIVFPTESRKQYLERVAAQVAGVEQWRAEKRLWKGAEDQRERFAETLRYVQTLPWMLVDRSEITPEEVALAVRILRRQWPGQHVIIIVDHMHRLDYGGEDADDVAGTWTRRFKNMATSDTDGGMTFHLLYQPKKPDKEHGTHRPVDPYEIRGHGSISNECDVYVSPYRCHVLVDPELGVNPWGSTRTKRYEDGRPVIGTKGQVANQLAKLSDEDAFLWVGKRRVGGELDTPFHFRYEARTSRIYEAVPEAEHLYHPVHAPPIVTLPPPPAPDLLANLN